MGELISLSMQVLAGIVPRHFGQSEVFERLIALLRNPDKELGGACSVHMCSISFLEGFHQNYICSPCISACDVLQILKLTGDFIDQSSIRWEVTWQL